MEELPFDVRIGAVDRLTGSIQERGGLVKITDFILDSRLPVLGRATTATDYFNDPHRVCTLLDSEGLVTGRWNPVAYGYECSTERQVVVSDLPIPFDLADHGWIAPVSVDRKDLRWTVVRVGERRL